MTAGRYRKERTCPDVFHGIVAPPLICARRAGHRGAHRSADGAQWDEVAPAAEVLASWAEGRVTPSEIAHQRSLGWPDFHPEDFCHQCGRRNPNWFADTAEWQTATGSTGDGGGVLCPSCFAALWESVTGKAAIIWRLSIDPRSRDALTAPLAAQHTTDEEADRG